MPLTTAAKSPTYICSQGGNIQENSEDPGLDGGDACGTAGGILRLCLEGLRYSSTFRIGHLGIHAAATTRGQNALHNWRQLDPAE